MEIRVHVDRPCSSLQKKQDLGSSETNIDALQLDTIEVGRPVAQPPPPRSRRADFPHRALPYYSLRTRHPKYSSEALADPRLQEPVVFQ
jgi:hypothetical protein